MGEGGCDRRRTTRVENTRIYPPRSPGFRHARVYWKPPTTYLIALVRAHRATRYLGRLHGHSSLFC